MCPLIATVRSPLRPRRWTDRSRSLYSEYAKVEQQWDSSIRQQALRYRFFYNVVHAVGHQCPNMRDDVKLVQYLLKAFYENAPDTSKPNGIMAVDGLCGPTNRGGINRFEMDMTGPGQVAFDGRIDRVRDQSMTSSVSQTYYALVLLNRWTIKFNPGAWICSQEWSILRTRQTCLRHRGTSSIQSPRIAKTNCLDGKDLGAQCQEWTVRRR